MRKKILAVFGLLAGFAMLGACDSGDTPVCQHSFTIEKSDETNHWKECELCGDPSEVTPHAYNAKKHDDNKHWNECECGAKSGEAEHAYNTEKHDDNKHWDECECGAKSGEAEHAYNTENHDDNKHWNECECGVKSGEAEHEYTNGKCDGQKHWKECDCGAITDEAEHDYSEWQHDETKHWQQCSCGDTTEEVSHEYTTEKHDDNKHWDECECGAKSEEGNHAFGEWQHDDSKHWKECACGEKAEEANHAYTIEKHDENKHWKECECGAKSEEADHAFGEWQHDDSKHWKECECGEKAEEAEHVYDTWYTAEEKYDYKACKCGVVDRTQSYDKSVSLINQELLMTEDSVAINIKGIGAYDSIESIKLGKYNLGKDTAGITVTDELREDTQIHGEQTIIVTVKCADGATHEVKVPVTLITAEITSAGDFQDYVQPKVDRKGVYGYYILTKDFTDTGLAGSAYSGDWEETTGFFGTFDGRGYTISTAANGANGIFGVLRGATIKNVTIKDNWRSAYPSYALLAKATFNSTLENVTFVYGNGNTNTNVGNTYGWISYAEFSGNTLKNVTVNDSVGYGSLFGYKFNNNTFENVKINGTYAEMGHTAPVTDDDGNVLEEEKAVSYDDVTKMENKVEKVTLQTRQDFVLDGAVSVLDLGDYNDAELLSIQTSTGYALYGLASDVAPASFVSATSAHGEQNFIITVKTAEGKLVEITAPVTVVTKAIGTLNEFVTTCRYYNKNIQGYYILTADISYSGWDTTAAATAGYKWMGDKAGFMGTLDGRGKTITWHSSYGHGIFGTTYGATIKNVTMKQAWFNNTWDATLVARCIHYTTLENVTIDINSNPNTNTTDTTNTPIAMQTGGCVWKNVKITAGSGLGALIATTNKDNVKDTYENVTVTLPSLIQFSNNGTPDGVTITQTAKA